MTTSTTTKRAAATATLLVTISSVAGTMLAPVATAATKVTTKWVTGTSVNTPFGPVQVKAKVKVTTTGKRVLAATAVQYPSQDRKSQMINAQAIPLLQQQAVANKNGTIDGVSGASYSASAFQKSLQSALAKLA